MKKLLAGLVILLALVSCDTPTGNSNNGNTPTLTDIMLVADIDHILTGPYLTTLNAGTEYIVLIFASDQDLDISKFVVDYIKDGIFVTTIEMPTFGQATITELFVGYFTPPELGTWKVEVFVEDAKGNKSNKKSITVTVNDTETHTHEWGNWTQTTAPTCTTAGIETRVCTLDATHQETRAGAAAIGHDWGDWEVTTAPTATVDGEETRTCKHDPTHTETRIIPATGSNNNAPTLTDIKIVTDISQLLTGPYLTTLTVGTQYVVLLFGSDQDLDITKIVVDYYKNNTFVMTGEAPASGQIFVSDVFMGYLNATEDGTWKVEAYLEDAKGNKSNKKSITVTVNDTVSLLFDELETNNSYVTNNGNTAYYRKNLSSSSAKAYDDIVCDLAINAGYSITNVSQTSTISMSSLPNDIWPNNGTYLISYSVSPDKSYIGCLYGVRNNNNFIGFFYELEK